MNELHLQSSQMTTFMQCPRKWYYTYAKWRSIPPNAAMQKGTCFHLLCELHFKDNIAFEDLSAAVEERNPELCVHLAETLPALLHYKAHYSDSPYTFVELDGETAIELEFKIALTDSIFYHGKFDSLRERDGKQYIFDWKVTKMSPTDWYFKPFQQAYQTFSYSFAARECFSDCNGFFIDAIQIKNGSHNFARRYFPLLNIYDEFVAELIRTGEWIQQHLHDENYFEHRYTACVSKYGSLCEFAPVCTSRPDARPDILASDLYVDNKPIYDFSEGGKSEV